jgi:hypothetical protein
MRRCVVSKQRLFKIHDSFQRVMAKETILPSIRAITSTLLKSIKWGVYGFGILFLVDRHISIGIVWSSSTQNFSLYIGVNFFKAKHLHNCKTGQRCINVAHFSGWGFVA